MILLLNYYDYFAVVVHELKIGVFQDCETEVANPKESDGNAFHHRPMLFLSSQLHAASMSVAAARIQDLIKVCGLRFQDCNHD